jgi:hypothetical protein
MTSGLVSVRRRCADTFSLGIVAERCGRLWSRLARWSGLVQLRLATD